MMRSLIDKVSATIKKHRMLAGGERVLVGLSGGADSVCLTLALKKLGTDLHALYVDHGLRPEETPAEIDFCAGFCRKVGVPFESTSVDVKARAAKHNMNKQEAARELRYWALEEDARRLNAEKVALGHTLDDQVETFLMRLMRGSGMRGLSSIPPVRGDIIRPLIETTREEVEGFLVKEGVGFITDSSNLEDEYLRNRVRRALVPVLKGFNPGLMNTLGNAADVFRDEERLLEVMTTKAMMRLITRKDASSIELFLAPLENMDTVILRRALRRAVEETKGLRGVGFVHIEDVIRLVKEGLPGDRVYLPKEIRAIKKYSTLLLTSAPPVELGAYTMDKEGLLVLREAEEALEARVVEGAAPAGGERRAVLDADKAPFPLTVRPRRDGDYFHPAGFGRRKKLQDFFVDEKVPRDERGAVPIVASGEDIVWVAGMRADERAMPTGDTKRFLVLELKKGRR